MSKLLLIKLGGSLITHKSQGYTALPEVILRLAKEIKSAQKHLSDKIIIAHGSGSFGHQAAAKYQTRDGLINTKSFKGLPIVADAAIQINRHVIQGFLSAQVPVISFSPASFIHSQNRKPKSFFVDPIFHALKLGYLPITYGDIVFDRTHGFCIYSSETTLGHLARQLSPKFTNINIIYCGNTNGIYDQQGNTITTITPKTFNKISSSITGSNQIDVTGGMLHKVQQSLALAKLGWSTRIINGQQPNQLKHAMLGRSSIGTLICPD